MTKKITLILILLVIVALQAASDAFYDDGVKDVSKILEVVYIAMFLVLPLFKFHWTIIFAYISFRVLYFALIYNLIRGLAWDYCGSTTALYDQHICPLIFSPMYLILSIVLTILAVHFVIRFYKK